MLDVRTTSLTKKYFYVINTYEFAIDSLYYDIAERKWNKSNNRSGGNTKP